VTSSIFSNQLLAWFDLYGRKDLPWQQQVTPYHVWLSEIMLQQTQVSTVIPYYQRITKQFNTINSLAEAAVDDVLALWTGLGYYARARNLHKAAIIMAQQHNGEMPTSYDELIALPGIGRSTAGAILTLAHQQHYAILDGNVKRVLTRYFAIDGWPGKKDIENQLWQKAEQLLPTQRIANYIQAQMDLGATVCTRTKPQCESCPLKSNCLAFKQGQPTLYPTSKPKKSIPSRQTHWLIAQTATGEILLEQRPQQGIWGGLWSFPEVEDEGELDYHRQQLNLIEISKVKLIDINHVFSHFKLKIHPYLIQCEQQTNHVAENNNLSWYKINDALRLGLPAPVKTVIQSLQ
jgi:A/G-specific adenine glycosylase